MINLPGWMVLPPEVAKIFQIRKIKRFAKSDTDISDLIIECFNRDENCHFSGGRGVEARPIWGAGGTCPPSSLSQHAQL